MTDITARAVAPRDVRKPLIPKIKDRLNEYVDAVARRRPKYGDVEYVQRATADGLQTASEARVGPTALTCSNLVELGEMAEHKARR